MMCVIQRFFYDSDTAILQLLSKQYVYIYIYIYGEKCGENPIIYGIYHCEGKDKMTQTYCIRLV